MSSITMGTICITVLMLMRANTENCKYGRFNEYNGECMFDCEYQNNYVATSTLSFDFIAEQCDDVRTANEDGICDNLDDLVWRDDQCQCPYCACSSAGTSYKEVINYNPELKCYEITCDQLPSYNGNITDNIYQRQHKISVFWANEYDLFGCPPNTCINGTKIAGDSWWNDTDPTCTTFCYCPGDGEAICETGSANIIANEALSYQFIKKCGHQNNIKGVE